MAKDKWKITTVEGLGAAGNSFKHGVKKIKDGLETKLGSWITSQDKRALHPLVVWLR